MIDRLFRALWAVGLDRRQLSIHEMLTDILEVLQLAAGAKPAHLAGQGEGAAWRIAEFERIAAAAGLHVLRTPRLAAPAAQREALEAEFPLIGAAMRAAAAPTADAPTVLWIYRRPELAGAIRSLVAGDGERVPEVLGYPPCCARHDTLGELNYVRALLRLYARQHGLHGEAAVLEAMRAGTGVRPAPDASVELEAVWRSRLAFPYLGYSACPHCLSLPDSSPSAHLNRSARQLAFGLDTAYGVALWQAAWGEAALATRGDFRALDPQADDPCPCGSGLAHGACCAGRRAAMPDFR